MRRRRLRAARLEKELTVAELARRTGLHPTVIFELESGRRKAYPKYKKLLSEVLGVPSTQLFGSEEDERKQDNGCTNQ